MNSMVCVRAIGRFQSSSTHASIHRASETISKEREDRMACIRKTSYVAVAAIALIAAIGGTSLARAADVLADWVNVTLPPPPELKPVTLDGKTTALLILDIQAPACTMAERPRCVDAIPKIK